MKKENMCKGNKVFLIVMDCFAGTGIVKEVTETGYWMDMISWSMCYRNSHIEEPHNIFIEFEEIVTIEIVKVEKKRTFIFKKAV